MVGASETDKDTKNIQVICDTDGTIGIIKTSAVSKDSKGSIIKSKVPEEATLKIVKKDAYVYSSDSSKSNKIGVVRKNTLVAVNGTKGLYSLISTPNDIGYVRASNIEN